MIHKDAANVIIKKYKDTFKMYDSDNDKNISRR
jgi:hypothetical protein